MLRQYYAYIAAVNDAPCVWEYAWISMAYPSGSIEALYASGELPCMGCLCIVHISNFSSLAGLRVTLRARMAVRDMWLVAGTIAGGVVMHRGIG